MHAPRIACVPAVAAVAMMLLGPLGAAEARPAPTATMGTPTERAAASPAERSAAKESQGEERKSNSADDCVPLANLDLFQVGRLPTLADLVRVLYVMAT